jgi:hypothetical protein
MLSLCSGATTRDVVHIRKSAHAHGAMNLCEALAVPLRIALLECTVDSACVWPFLCDPAIALGAADSPCVDCVSGAVPGGADMPTCAKALEP